MPNESDDKGAGDGGNPGEGAGDGQKPAGTEDTVTVKKSEFEKNKTDLENYKQMGNKYKTDYEKLVEDNKKNIPPTDQSGTSQIDENKVSEISRKASRDTLRETNERTASKQFFKEHPEYNDEAMRTQLLAEMSFKGSELTVDEIQDRFESALLEHKRKTGKLDEYLASQVERARTQGRMEGQMSQGGSGGAGDRIGGYSETNKLSEKGVEMARNMHVDPDKVRKADPLKDNVIDVLAKKK